jgi:phytoene dehydrogenase-like protein
METVDCIVIGGGHNGLVAACYLAKAGKSVVILEANERIGGATTSVEAFPGVPARLSRYSYLISLFPEKIRTELGIDLRTIKRTVSSYTPNPRNPSSGLLVPVNRDGELEKQMQDLTGSVKEADAWRSFYNRLSGMARNVFPTLTEPLRSREEMKTLVNDDEIWNGVFENPIGELIEKSFENDLVRGVVLTDALIGTFAGAHDESLLQNKCFLYHVIGNGSGDWDVPVGGMGALVQSLVDCAKNHGVRILTGARVTSVVTEGEFSTVSATMQSSGQTAQFQCRYTLANCSPLVLKNLLPEGSAPLLKRSSLERSPSTGGAQIKVNMLLKRLPQLKDRSVLPSDAFSGTFHINETYEQLATAFESAKNGCLPDPIPAEVYCHSLADPSILGEELRAAGAQTLTLFALHTPHFLFEHSNEEMRAKSLQQVLKSLNSVLDEPIETLLWEDSNGQPCIEISTTVDIEKALNIPTGNIFHTPLEWPFAESSEEVGTWGVETSYEGIILCGSGARRGGGVSGVAGHNAACCVLQRMNTTSNFP